MRITVKRRRQLQHGLYVDEVVRQSSIGWICHKEDGPASVTHWRNGNLQAVEYLQDGRRHRLDGPAVIRYLPRDIDEEWQERLWFYRGGGIASEVGFLISVAVRAWRYLRGKLRGTR